ncbi:histone-like nucleoid-structuring protein Lsr2 [Microbacterium testaceum]|uniref:histone-like nucleoid-structuring protein Lsr2 n=1 Tax=Microbacterium testaceum TaxID=2033 RepID=UPI002AC62921|nr:Lsr2 family protein [Microbacterium testaceum]MDZ5146120.1 Lsr2 family protein [Microbacterium testaceum]
MAQKNVVVYTDDLDGATLQAHEVQIIRFTYAGDSYEIDLGESNAKNFDDAIAPFIDAARKVRNSTSRTFRVTQSRDLNAVRTWARANGHTVSDRGRVPGTIIEAYDKAHG